MDQSHRSRNIDVLTGAPEVLYHYTNFKGLEGILRSQTVWASHIQDMNDKSEYLHFAQLAIDKLKGILSRCTEPEHISELKATIRKVRSLDPHVFVVSLSEMGDLKSQWDAYGQFAIGFCTKKLRPLSKGRGRELNRVEYSSKNHLLHLDHLESYAVRRSHGIRRRFPQIYCSRFIGLASFMKHEGFFEECEWRLIVQLGFRDVAKVKYRLRKSKRVPYIEIPLSKMRAEGLPIAHIIVGPKAYANEYRGVVKLLQSLHMHIPVHRSTLPLR